MRPLRMADMTARHDFLIDRQDLSRTCWEYADLGTREDLSPGQARVAHKRFAFTSNNITYARCGELLAYWRYFPAAGSWGSIPVWGIGQVIHSRHDELAEGEYVYGYFPMSSHLVLEPERVKATGFVDATPHRAELPRTYNEYVRIDRDLAYDAADADAHLVLRPLFSLSFFLAHFLVDAAFFGTSNVIISSDSSKTAMGLAFQLRRIGFSQVRTIGLTGLSNIAFVENAGLYDHVFAYSEITSLSEHGPSLYVDIVGNDRIRADVHRTLGNLLLYSCGVGMTHALPDPLARETLPAPAPEFFFTPKHILARRESWGPDELRRRLALEWQAFVTQARTWLTIECSSGQAAVEQVYAAVLNGKRPPDRADILCFDAA
jgi:hypothetical protein